MENLEKKKRQSLKNIKKPKEEIEGRVRHFNFDCKANTCFVNEFSYSNLSIFRHFNAAPKRASVHI